VFDRLRPYFQRQPRVKPPPPPPAPAQAAAAKASAPAPAAPPPPTPAAQQPAAPAPAAAQAPTPAAQQPTAPAASPPSGGAKQLAGRREELARQLAELQWDLGGLTYEMALRDQFRPELLAQRAALLQQVDAELASVDRMLQLEQAGAAGSCPKCRALYTAGAVYCWQCGTPLAPQQPATTAQPSATTAQPPAT
jgi:hypothetical protein